MPKTAAAFDRKATRELTPEDAREIAVEAYTYAYPLVLMEITRRVATNVAAPTDTGRAPMNRFAHMRSFPDASFTDVVSPNADTLYSLLWFDVSSEPLVIEVPDSGGRYYLLPILDMWSDVYASPGSRTTGDGEQAFAIIGPRWYGSLPSNLTVLRSPTDQGWTIGRTQTNGRSDYDAVQEFQDALTAVPLSLYGREYVPPNGSISATIESTAPVEQVAKMDAAAFFSLFATLTRKNPPHPHDHPILARMRRLGLEPGKLFQLEECSPVAKAAFEEAPKLAMRAIESEMIQTGPLVNGWRFIAQPIGTYGADYLHRASVARLGLGANVAEDAVYPAMFAGADGKPLDSGGCYTLRFPKGQLPPVRAFWSVTVYNERHFFAQNPIDRYAIGGRDNLIFNDDGSLDICVQRVDPGSARRSNWLPTPSSGVFTLAMRLYWPSPEVRSGVWSPPPLQRASF